MPATVIAERVGWDREMTVLRGRVAELRPLFAPPDPAQRTWYRPGELAQFDLWQPDVEIPVGFDQTAKLWTVVGVSGFSRLISALMVPSRAAHDVLAGMLDVIGGFGAVPRKAVWDQEGCIGRIRGGKQVLTAEFQAFRGVLGMGVVLVGPSDPEAKGASGTGQRLFGDQFPSRPVFRRHRRFQPAAGRVVETGQPADPRDDEGAAV
jgi:hypothetical protein